MTTFAKYTLLSRDTQNTLSNIGVSPDASGRVNVEQAIERLAELADNSETAELIATALSSVTGADIPSGAKASGESVNAALITYRTFEFSTMRSGAQVTITYDMSVFVNNLQDSNEYRKGGMRVVRARAEAVDSNGKRSTITGSSQSFTAELYPLTLLFSVLIQTANGNVELKAETYVTTDTDNSLNLVARPQPTEPVTLTIAQFLETLFSKFSENSQRITNLEAQKASYGISKNSSEIAELSQELSTYKASIDQKLAELERQVQRNTDKLT